MRVELTDDEIEYLLARVGVECKYAFCSCCPRDLDSDTQEAAAKRRDLHRSLRRKLVGASS